ncbi:MAG: bifunctional folylpolyglutamate synthase/dihydrofolate synthase [Fusobacteriota bacterium]
MGEDNTNILDEIQNISKTGIKLGLENINLLLDSLDNPQNNYKIIHIAGSNGKGSLATMLENILHKSGYSVGKYTSPHLVRFNERIRYNLSEISDLELKENFKSIKKIIIKNNIEATFFDITTAIMFSYFSKKKIDYLVLETGLGGRYDSTNIVNSDVVAITNISFDHSDFLGDTIEKISYEKAGIIKNNIPVFHTVKQDNAKKVINKVAKKMNSKVHDVLSKKYEISLNPRKICTIIKIDNLEFQLPLYGKFQGENFLLAYEISKYLNIPIEFIKKGLDNLIWEGRFEILERNPFIILDGAHNIDSAIKLKENMLSLFKKDDIIVITSILKDKEIPKILEEFHKFSNDVIFTSLKNNHRGLSGKQLSSYDNNFNKKYICEDIKEAIKKGKSLGKKAIVIAGSLYLIGEVKRRVYRENI